MLTISAGSVLALVHFIPVVAFVRPSLLIPRRISYSNIAQRYFKLSRS